MGFHDEGEGSREALLEEGEDVAVHGTDVFGCLAEAFAEHGVFCLLEFESLELRDGLDSLLVFHAAGETVEGVGGQNDDAAARQGVGYTPHFACVRVPVVEFYKHFLCRF